MLLFRGRDDSWSVAGNGGRMAEVQRKSRGNKAAGETGSKKKDTRASRCKTARVGDAEHVNGTEQVDGAEQLRLAVDRQVGLYSEELAIALRERAMGGDIVTARALVALAAGKKPRAEPAKKRRWPTYAMELAADTPWKGDMEEGSAEMGEGGVERE